MNLPRLAYVLLVITMGEAEGPFQTANILKEEISGAQAHRPDSMTGLNRTFRLHEMHDLGDIGWWMKTALAPTIDPESSRMDNAVKIVPWLLLIWTFSEIRSFGRFSGGLCENYSVEGHDG